MAKQNSMSGKWTAVGLVAAGVLLAVLAVKFRLTSPIPSAPIPQNEQAQEQAADAPE